MSIRTGIMLIHSGPISVEEAIPLVLLLNVLLCLPAGGFMVDLLQYLESGFGHTFKFWLGYSKIQTVFVQVVQVIICVYRYFQVEALQNEKTTIESENADLKEQIELSSAELNDLKDQYSNLGKKGQIIHLDPYNTVVCFFC